MKHLPHTPKERQMSARPWIVPALAIFVGSILAANWLTTQYGFIPVGFGYMSTAGTFAAGFTLAARDLLHDLIGRWRVVAIILACGVLSFALADPMIAIASAVAFTVAELADLAVYSPIRTRSRLGDKRWATAVIASNLVGAVLDTAIFLGIAFGAAAILPALAGQLVGKAWATVAYLAIGKAVSIAVPREPLQPVGA